jgi:hypothetical protein
MMNHFLVYLCILPADCTFKATTGVVVLNFLAVVATRSTPSDTDCSTLLLLLLLQVTSKYQVK